MSAGESLRCEAGQRWQWDGVAFEVLHPQPQDFERVRKPNALSCVLRVQGRDASVLLTGDIERQQEAALVAADAAALRSDMLIVPHHGSRSSSSAALLDAVQPSIAVIQAGYRNRFAHPAPEQRSMTSTLVSGTSRSTSRVFRPMFCTRWWHATW